MATLIKQKTFRLDIVETAQLVKELVTAHVDGWAVRFYMGEDGLHYKIGAAPWSKAIGHDESEATGA